jgi:hypothetical protein
MKNELHHEFDNSQIDHCTHYDYLKQLIDNGQLGSFKLHLQSMSNKALVDFITDAENYSMSYVNALKAEILLRML